jgi:hypothetical protein
MWINKLSMGIWPQFTFLVLLFSSLVVDAHGDVFNKRSADTGTYLLGVGKGDITG